MDEVTYSWNSYPYIVNKDNQILTVLAFDNICSVGPTGPQAYIWGANASGIPNVYRICPGTNTPTLFSDVQIEWDGSTIGPSGPMVTYTGTAKPPGPDPSLPPVPLNTPYPFYATSPNPQQIATPQPLYCTVPTGTNGSKQILSGVFQTLQTAGAFGLSCQQGLPGAQDTVTGTQNNPPKRVPDNFNWIWITLVAVFLVIIIAALIMFLHPKHSNG